MPIRKSGVTCTEDEEEEEGQTKLVRGIIGEGRDKAGKAPTGNKVDM